jgi:GNAT superfamily N-acetyltransferase
MVRRYTRLPMSSDIPVRRVTPADAPAISRIVFEAFKSIADRHNFPLDFPSLEAAQGLARLFINHPKIRGVAAEVDGKIIGSNFIDERDEIRGIGPITIDPAFQGRGAGRKLMQAILEMGKGASGIRLVQDAFNTVSMPLYASLGFEVKEPLVLMKGKPSGHASGRSESRALREEDLVACAALCRSVHGIDRSGELSDAIKMFQPIGLFRSGQVVAYASAPNLWPLNHGVAETEEDLTDLILAAGAAQDQPIEMLVPTRRASFFRWCIASGLRVVKPMTLMTMGKYQEPAGSYYPSVLY